MLLAGLCVPLQAQEQAGGDLDEFFRSVTGGQVETVREGLRRHPDWANAELFMGIRPVYRASVLGREEVLAVLLESGADVNATTERGTHPLHAAAQNGYARILDRLLTAGAPINVSNEAGQTPLVFAIRFGHQSLAELLVARGASTQTVDAFGRTPLHYAAGAGRLEATRFLVENGTPLDVVDLHGYTALGWCRAQKRNDYQQVSDFLEQQGAADRKPDPPEPSAERPSH
jgi:ankyrin repeat protein